MITRETIQPLAELLEAQQLARLISDKLDCECNRNNAKTTVHIGKKFARLDIGSSGRYMINLETGEIFGVKAYGVVHLGHRFGTLDTIRDWDWSDYRARLKLKQAA